MLRLWQSQAKKSVSKFRAVLNNTFKKLQNTMYKMFQIQNYKIFYSHSFRIQNRTQQGKSSISHRWQTARRIYCATCNGVADRLKHAPVLCYHAKFGRSRSNRVRIKGKNPKVMGSAGTLSPWDGRRGSPQETRPSPYVSPCQTRSLCVKGCKPQNWGTTATTTTTTTTKVLIIYSDASLKLQGHFTYQI